MKAKWRNTGAPFTLDDGTEVRTGEVFEAEVQDRGVQMRRHKLEPVAPDTEVTAHHPRERFHGVEFGSEAAYELARDSGLTSVDFRWHEGSGQDGAFLKADVRDVLDG